MLTKFMFYGHEMSKALFKIILPHVLGIDSNMDLISEASPCFQLQLWKLLKACFSYTYIHPSELFE